MVKRFANPGPTPIWKSIQYMDHEGMDLLRKPALKGAVDAWESYLGRTKVEPAVSTLTPEHHLRAQPHHCAP
jgi:hypothetical protein